MKVFRIYLTSWTASFRYPNLISGFQPTLPVPPLSTVHGLISAALGRYYAPEKPEIGFVFQTSGKAVDLETIYQIKISSDEVIPNVVRREFLFDNHLWIYTQMRYIADAFQRPFFQLLLGRSGDLATVNDIAEIEVEPTTILTRLRGTIIPFGKYALAAAIQALPMNFSNTIPRRNIGTKPYYLLESRYRQAKTQPILANGFIDYSNRFFEKQNGIEIYWQE
ncbi:MAG: type I-B CRISPR-associated protein Cas5b [candidate division KSB1 bacterium]|nr:type I-B CRISPR-associated protein Cas5b [candidate division KSB1 bacterium]